MASGHGERMNRLSLRKLLAKASPLRSGDVLAGVAAANEEEPTRARMALAEASFVSQGYASRDPLPLLASLHAVFHTAGGSSLHTR